MELDKKFLKKALKYIFICALGCILIYWLLHDADRVSWIYNFVMSLLSPFIVGAVLAFILNVPMRAIEGWFRWVKQPGLRRVLALVITTVFVLLLIAGVFWLLIPQLIDTVASIGPKLQSFLTKAQTYVQVLQEDYPDLYKWVTDWIAENLKTEEINWADEVKDILDKTYSAIGTASSVLVNAFISVVFAYYCLFQKETLARQGRKLLYAFLPEQPADEIVRVLRLSNATFSNFLSGQCIEVVILGVMFAITMTIFRMPYVLLISVLVAVTAFIPVAGAWVGCVVGAFLILVNNPLQAVWFVVMFVILQQIENHLIYPRVVGNSIGLSGMWVLVAISLGGSLMGVAGMFLMIPLVSVIYTLIREVTAKRLAKRDVAEDKLQPQPPQLRSKLRKNKKQKQEAPQQEEKNQ